MLHTHTHDIVSIYQSNRDDWTWIFYKINQRQSLFVCFTLSNLKIYKPYYQFLLIDTGIKHLQEY